MSDQRAITYCIVAGELAAELHEPLRQHWRDDPSIEVIVERRTADRRGSERRRRDTGPPAERERRAVRNPSGRRVAERRAAKARVLPPPLPRKARRHAGRLAFVQRRVPSGQAAEDVATARLVVEYQVGDRSALEDIYMRYFDRVYTYARMVLHSPVQAEEVTQRVFERVVEGLPRYRVRGPTPFRAWLFRIARGTILEARTAELPGQREEVAVLEMHGPPGAASSQEQELDWLTDVDLYRFVERLPARQREVLVLRYFLDLSHEEVATTLDQSAVGTRELLSRALQSLDRALQAAGRSRGRSSRSAMCMRAGRAPVISARRSALHGEVSGLLGVR